MASIAFALPLQPGQTEPWRHWSTELAGPKQAEYRASRQRFGITVERAYLQQTPMGNFVVVYIETGDIERAMGGLATSQDPFDVWFRQKGLELWGIDLGQPDAAPMLDSLFDVLSS